MLLTWNLINMVYLLAEKLGSSRYPRLIARNHFYLISLRNMINVAVSQRQYDE